MRDALRGKTRFSEFRDSLHVSTDILASRLATLVDAGVLERRSYRDAGSRERDSYRLTERGRELSVVLAAFTVWGDKHRPNDFTPAAYFRAVASHAPVSVVFTEPSGRVLDVDEVELVSAVEAHGGTDGAAVGTV